MDNNRDIPHGRQAGYSAQLFDPKICGDKSLIKYEQVYADFSKCINATHEDEAIDSRILKSLCFSYGFNCLISIEL